MNLLSLARAVKRESGLGSSATDPAAFATAAGDDLRMFQWVIWAWRDIDLMHESWQWRRASATATTAGSRVLGPADVAPGFALADFGSWLPASREYQPSAYKVSAGQIAEGCLQWLDYDQFRKAYTLGTHTAAPLVNWSIAPNGDLLVGPTPDEAHVVRADYIKDHAALAADADEPTMPSRFHMLIVWRALREYGGFDAASEVFQRADGNYRAMLPQLSQAQLPKMRWSGRPLA